MEILINELSLHKQFDSNNDFIDNSFTNFIIIYSFLDGIGNHPLKNYNFYNSQISDKDSIYSFLKNPSTYRVYDIVRKYKLILDKITTEPFWESDIKHDLQADYKCKGEKVTKTSIAEAFDRDSVLLSFSPSRFSEEKLSVTKDEQGKGIHNFYHIKKLLPYLYENKLIDFYCFCKFYYKNSKLRFDYVNKEKSFDLITNKHDEKEFQNSFDVFCEMSWQNIISQGGKGDKKVGLAYERYHDQTVFKNYNTNFEIYKFRSTQRYRVFGYREKENFFVLEFDLSHRLSD